MSSLRGPFGLLQTVGTAQLIFLTTKALSARSKYLPDFYAVCEPQDKGFNRLVDVPLLQLVE